MMTSSSPNCSDTGESSVSSPTMAAPAELSMDKAIAKVESLLSHRFRNRTLILEALTHSSHPSSNTASYQRLEFLGDSALCLAVSNHIYLTNPSASPSLLSSLRAANISTEKLARAAVKYRLYPLVRRASPSLDAMVQDFTTAVASEDDNLCETTAYGGSTVRAPKVLADIVESIVGAVYIDLGFDLAKTWVHIRGILEPFITSRNYNEQPVSMLYEVCQKQGKEVQFLNWAKDVTTNICNVFVDGELLGMGCSERKNMAKLNAAREALQKLLARLKENPIKKKEKTGKRALSEACSQNRWQKPVYRVESEEGPSHDRQFKCLVHVRMASGELVARGGFKRKMKDAEHSAAMKLLKKIRPAAPDDAEGGDGEVTDVK